MKKGGQIYYSENKSDNHLAGLLTSQMWRKIQGANFRRMLNAVQMNDVRNDLGNRSASWVSFRWVAI